MSCSTNNIRSRTRQHKSRAGRSCSGAIDGAGSCSGVRTSSRTAIAAGGSGGGGGTVIASTSRGSGRAGNGPFVVFMFKETFRSISTKIEKLKIKVCDCSRKYMW